MVTSGEDTGFERDGACKCTRNEEVAFCTPMRTFIISFPLSTCSSYSALRTGLVPVLVELSVRVRKGREVLNVPASQPDVCPHGHADIHLPSPALKSSPHVQTTLSQRVCLCTLQAMWQAYGTSTELLELRNLVSVGELILMSGLRRHESRGGHFCLDYPGPALGHPRTTVIGDPAHLAAKTSAPHAGGKVKAPSGGKALGPGSKLVSASVPLRGKLAAKKGGLIERARAREVALKSQKEDLE